MHARTERTERTDDAVDGGDRPGDGVPAGSAAGAGGSGDGRRRAPAVTEAFRAELGLLFRRKWALAGLAVAAALPMTVVAASLSGAESVTLAELLRGTWIFPSLLAVAWPAIAVWRDEPPSERSYSWTLPLDRPVLHLVRAAAGWVHLAAGLAAGLALAWAAGASIHDGMAPGGGGVLVAALPSATVLYLVGTLPALTTDRPLLWLFVVFLALSALEALATARGWGWLETGLAEVFTSGPLSLTAASVLPRTVSGDLGGSNVTVAPWRAAGLWLAVSVALAAAAARIHLERVGEG